MTASTSASAPGKLVLLGEYAVLYGGPAAVLAVNRRAQVALRASDDTLWSVRSPGLSAAPASFELRPDGCQHWVAITEDEASTYRLLSCVLQSLTQAGLLNPATTTPAHIDLDTRAFFEPTNGGAAKLGLGSSAALTVALSSAVVRWAGCGNALRDPFDWLATVVAIHREFQGGRGSGIDLAASLFGGVLEYGLDAGGAPEIARPLTLPKGLFMLPVWTGRSADTGAFLGRLSERFRVDPQGIHRTMNRLSETSRRGIDALSSSRVGDFLDEVRRFRRDLEDLGRQAAMPILSAEHQRMLALTPSPGVAYKPSGAGGGDLGLFLADSPEVLESLAIAVRDAGFEPIDLAVDTTGLAEDPTRSPEDSPATRVYD